MRRTRSVQEKEKGVGLKNEKRGNVGRERRGRRKRGKKVEKHITYPATSKTDDYVLLLERAI